MPSRARAARALVLVAACALGAPPAPLRAQSPAVAPAAAPPPVSREFRGVWLVTVNNSDWPSRPGLSTWEQQQELLALLNRAVQLRLNAVIFHARTGADAFYASPTEPWAQFLTGVQGLAPEPAWDPLAFAVAKAHERGLELHAWFNPYKAHYVRDTAVAARTHLVRTRPELVRPYGRFVWMDPGEPEVRRRAVGAILDVVRRYDVDGAHIDDFFYPYPERDSTGATLDFPDSASYARYRRGGGALARADWRRANVDRFVEEFHRGVKAIKPWVKVGVSPFGIWRPGHPPQIQGLDAYDQIYADARKWLREGWVDYLAPQLYWAIDPPGQSYPALLDWWIGENVKGRHVWVGNFTGRVGASTPPVWRADEIVRQVELTRARPGSTGNIHFPMRVLVRDPDSVATRLARLYAEPALVPASPWLGAAPPARPRAAVRVDAATGDRIVVLAPSPAPAARLWVVREHRDGRWTTTILPATQRRHRLAGSGPVWVTAVGRTGVESAPVVVGR